MKFTFVAKCVRSRRHAYGLAALFPAALAFCREPRNTAATPMAPFAQVITTTVEVAFDTSHALVTPVGLVVNEKEIVVIDQGSPAMAVFSRDNGHWRRTIGEPGDSLGQVRRPAAIVALDSGQFAIFDSKRYTLSIRARDGRVVSERAMSASFLNGMVALPDQRRVLLAGELRNVDGAAAKDFHEFDLSAQPVASYGATRKVDGYAAAFRAIAAARVGDLIVAGAMNSNTVRLVNRRTGAVREMAVADDWYKKPKWPSARERLALRKATQQNTAQFMTAWTQKQRLLNGVFSLTNGRFLVRFRGYEASGSPVFSYAVADTLGRTLLVTEATRANILQTKGDTLYWLSRDADRRFRLGVGVFAPARLSRTVSGDVRR